MAAHKICIASAHVNCRLHRLWRKLQWRFISEVTHCDFEYHVVVSGLDPAPFVQHASGVIHIQEKISHSQCLAYILEVFAQSDCTHCLLLDSDCWPVRVNWHDLLFAKLRHYKFTAPMRVENLDLFPHPSAVFFHKSYLPHIDFGYATVENLLGEKCSDLGAALSRSDCYPLLKTNYISPHPVFASIYGDCFYHHCAGSRGIGVRCADYYRHIISQHQQRKIYNRATSQLRRQPRLFINRLRGIGSRMCNV